MGAGLDKVTASLWVCGLAEGKVAVSEINYHPLKYIITLSTVAVTTVAVTRNISDHKP